MKENLTGCIVQVITNEDRFMGILENCNDAEWIKLVPFKDEEVQEQYGESVLLPMYKKESTIKTIIIIKNGKEETNNKKGSRGNDRSPAA